jgi:hypothetical protein
MKILTLLFALLWVALVSAEADTTLDRRLSVITSNWTRMSAEALSAPQNRDLFDEMKRRLLLKSEWEFAHNEYVGPLIKIGDDEILQRFVLHDEEYRNEDLLVRSQQPKIIALIGENLNRNEDLKGRRIGEDVLVLPKSVYSAGIIRSLIIACPVFSPDLKAWAHSIYGRPALMFKHPNDMAAMVRWWNENKELVRAGQYKSVKPPSRVTADNPAVTPHR